MVADLLPNNVQLISEGGFCNSHANRVASQLSPGCSGNCYVVCENARSKDAILSASKEPSADLLVAIRARTFLRLTRLTFRRS